MKWWIICSLKLAVLLRSNVCFGTELMSGQGSGAAPSVTTGQRCFSSCCTDTRATHGTAGVVPQRSACFRDGIHLPTRTSRERDGNKRQMGACRLRFVPSSPPVLLTTRAFSKACESPRGCNHPKNTLSSLLPKNPRVSWEILKNVFFFSLRPTRSCFPHPYQSKAVLYSRYVF